MRLAPWGVGRGAWGMGRGAWGVATVGNRWQAGARLLCWFRLVARGSSEGARCVRIGSVVRCVRGPCGVQPVTVTLRALEPPRQY